jgi:hypothetical protein
MRLRVPTWWRGSLTGRTTGPEILQAGLDMGILRIQVGGPLVSIQSIVDLVVARLVKSSQVIPDFADIRIKSDGSRVSIKCVPVLVDLVVEHSDRAPECRVASVPVDSLLISLVCFGVLLLRHVAATQEVPALSIVSVGLDRLFQILDGAFLALESVAQLVM